MTGTHEEYKLLENVKDEPPYSQPCLDGDKATADAFFNKISYQIDLTCKIV